jgi:cytosol alanyl aminopeptidase
MQFRHHVWFAAVLLGCTPSTKPAPATLAGAPATKPTSSAAATSALPKPPSTLRLPRTLVPTKYALTVTLDPRLDGFAGQMTIVGNVASANSVFWLHGETLQIQKALLLNEGKTVDVQVRPVGDDLLAVTTSTPIVGAVTLTIDYTGRYADQETLGVFKQVVAGDPSLFTQFEATYARRAMPCFDEPDNKVPWDITVQAPTGFDAVANTLPKSSTTLPNGLIRTEFVTSPPLPAYLVAFAVGHFEFVDAGKTRKGAPIRIIAPRGRGNEAAYAAATTGRLVEILEKWFGSAYPYDKLDLITVPVTDGWGAMENPGLITFTDARIMLDPKNASWRNRHAFISLAAHELAHQWFGNLVTTAWWDDIWLNEGFASWMEAKVLTAFDPSWHDELSIVSDWQDALDADSLISARQVRQPIEKLDDINSAFDGITYQKGGAVLSMFEHALGAEVFQKGVHIYLQKHRFGNATSTDFSAAMSQAAGRDVSAAFATFLDRPGAPQLTQTATCTSGTNNIGLTQRRYVPPGAPTPIASSAWQLPVCFAMGPASSVRSFAPFSGPAQKSKKPARTDTCVTLEQSQQTFPIAATADCSNWVLPNAGGYGYYRTALTETQLTSLLGAWPQLTAVERLVLFTDAQANLQDGSLQLTTLLKMLPLLLAENNRFAINNAVGLLQSLRPNVPEALRPRFDAWVVATLGKQARTIGWLPKANDSLDAEQIRANIVELVAEAGEATLRAQAVKLAASWKTLPESVRRKILAIAVDADSTLFAKILAELPTETSRRFRREMIDALRATTKLDQYAKVLQLILNPALDARETDGVLFSSYNDALRRQAETFFTLHFDKILARLPSEATTGSATDYIDVYTSNCSGDRRLKVRTILEEHFGKMLGADRAIAQSLETYDQCVATRAIYEPQLRTWLSSLK